MSYMSVGTRHISGVEGHTNNGWGSRLVVVRWTASVCFGLTALALCFDPTPLGPPGGSRGASFLLGCQGLAHSVRESLFCDVAVSEL